jgi:hypothetical protein
MRLDGLVSRRFAFLGFVHGRLIHTSCLYLSLGDRLLFLVLLGCFGLLLGVATPATTRLRLLCRLVRVLFFLRL